MLKVLILLLLSLQSFANFKLQVSGKVSNTKIQHKKSQKIYYTDHNGILNLVGVPTDYFIYLSNSNFTFIKDGNEIRKTLLSANANLKNYFPSKFIKARYILEQARNHTTTFVSESFLVPTEVYLDFEDGCNAAWDGRRILIDKGNEKCNSPAESTDIITHEYGHLVLEALAQTPFIGDDLKEAFADSYMALITNDPIFAEGFNLRNVSYIRRLDQVFLWPNDWRGKYSGSLIFSSLLWDTYQLLLNEKVNSSNELMMESILEIAFYFQSTNIMTIKDLALALYNNINLKLHDKHIFKKLTHLYICRNIIDGEQKNCSNNLEVSPQNIFNIGAAKIDYKSPYVKSIHINQNNIKKVILKSKIEHIFSEDLIIYMRLKDQIIQIYKGVEESQVPEKLLIPNFPKKYNGTVDLVFEDISPDFDGEIKEAALIIY